MERNVSAMLADVAAKGFSFRPHVKTLKVPTYPSLRFRTSAMGTQQAALVVNSSKTAEATRLMLGGRHRKVVVSTLAEIRGVLPLVKEECVDEVNIKIPVLDSTSAAAVD